MNRKSPFVIGCFFAVLGVLAGIVFCLFDNLSVSYECQIEFLYEDLVPKQNSRAPCGNYIENRQRILLSEFNSEYYPFTVDEMVRRCLSDPKLRTESEQRVRTVLSTKRFDVSESRCTNALYSYQLVLADREKRNLDEFARLCMKILKEKLQRENMIRADKASYNENQQMRKTERRIRELENKKDASAEDELRQARKMVKEKEQRIAEIKAQVMSRAARGVIYESPPVFSWVIRRKAKKGGRP